MVSLSYFLSMHLMWILCSCFIPHIWLLLNNRFTWLDFCSCMTTKLKLSSNCSIWRGQGFFSVPRHPLQPRVQHLLQAVHLQSCLVFVAFWVCDPTHVSASLSRSCHTSVEKLYRLSHMGSMFLLLDNSFVHMNENSWNALNLRQLCSEILLTWPRPRKCSTEHQED